MNKNHFSVIKDYKIMANSCIKISKLAHCVLNVVNVLQETVVDKILQFEQNLHI